MEVVKIGPYHPLLLEPEVYEVTVRDGKIVDVKIEQGFAHRGAEKLMESKSLAQAILVAERICGLCSQAHSTAYCQAVERVLNLEVPKRADYIRALVFELERIHSHGMWFGLLFHTINQHEAFMKVINAREEVMDLLEDICGNRIHYSINAVGGVRRDVCPELLRRVEDVAGKVEVFLNELLNLVKGMSHELSGIGVLPKDKARAWGAVGPVLRASGVASDIRKDDPYSVYSLLDFEVCVEDGCDVYSRVMVRAMELLESVKMIRQIVKEIPAGEIKADPPKPAIGEDFSRVEAPRGELIYFVRLNGSHRPERVKLRPPTYVNDPALKEMLVGEKLSNLPPILESIDRCISCTNRVTVIDEKTGKMKKFTLEELGRMR
ncbi:MAG: nickel-dependent hydrogenase large subunit [Candidatus Hadarchaeales archaeon]